MGQDEQEEPEMANPSAVTAPHQAASADDAARLSPEELLAEALRAFKQDADSAAQRASSSQSLSLQLPADDAANEQQPQPPQVQEAPQQMLQQSSSLPDLSKGATSEQSPAGESPSPATSEPGPGPQDHQAWGVLRPTPQRIGLGEINTGSLPLSPTSSLRPTASLKNLGGMSPISTSGPQRTEFRGAAGAELTDQAAATTSDGAGLPASPSWQPQGSAWKRYIAQASDAAAAFKGFGLTPVGQVGQVQPAASAPLELPSGQAAGQLPDEPVRPTASAGSTAALALSPRGLFPAQLSLERLQTQLQAPMQQNEDDAAQQLGRDPMQTLQAAASALFRQLIKPDPIQEGDEQPLQGSGSAPQGFGSRIPSMASNFQEAATSFLEAARANSIPNPAMATPKALEPQQAQHAQQAQQAMQQAWQTVPYLQLLQSMDSRQLQSLSTVSASPPPSAERQTDSDRAASTGHKLQKNWADAAAALLGPVGPRQQLNSAFSDALASRAGQLSSIAMPLDPGQPTAPPQFPQKGAEQVAAAPKEDWSTACFSSFKDSGCHYSLPLSGWQLPTGADSQRPSVSMPPSTTGDPNFLKMHGNLLAGYGNMGSLVMPSTPSLPNLPTKASVSPPLSPQDSMTPLGRQLEMCLARQVQVQNVKRHGPLQVLMSEDQMAAAAAAASGGKPQRFGQMSWAQQHSGQSLDSQLSKIQLAQAALEKADMFKVPGNLASFLKQASLDTAMAMLQPREATPPTPMARQLSGQGGGAVWPFGSPGMQHQFPMSPQQTSPDHRLSSLNLQSSPLRGMQSLQGPMHGGEQHRLQASQQVFQDMGKSAMAPQLHEAVLADSLYRSVTERLQSGAGPASFNQGGLNYGAAEDATFYRMDSGAAHGGAPNYSHMLAGHHPQQSETHPHQHMMELLGLLRAGLVTPQDQMQGGKRKRRSDSPGAWRKRRGDDMSEGHLDAQPPPKRSSNNKCEECGTTETPTWRRWGPTLLCNACGLRRKKNPKLQPPPKEAQQAEQPGQHQWDPSVQLPAEGSRTGDQGQLTHSLAAVPQ